MTPRKSILCVDDVEENNHIIRKVLGKKFNVTTTTNPDEFVKLAGQKKYDYFVVDYRMPHLSGVEAILEVNQPETPVFVVTADECIHCKLTKLRDFNFTLLMKPLDVNKLLLLLT